MSVKVIIWGRAGRTAARGVSTSTFYLRGPEPGSPKSSCSQEPGSPKPTFFRNLVIQRFLLFCPPTHPATTTTRPPPPPLPHVGSDAEWSLRKSRRIERTRAHGHAQLLPSCSSTHGRQGRKSPVSALPGRRGGQGSKLSPAHAQPLLLTSPKRRKVGPRDCSPRHKGVTGAPTGHASDKNLSAISRDLLCVA